MRRIPLLHTGVARVALNPVLVVSAPLADVQFTRLTQLPSIEDEAERLAAPDTAALVKLGLPGQELGLAVFLAHLLLYLTVTGMITVLIMLL